MGSCCTVPHRLPQLKSVCIVCLSMHPYDGLQKSIRENQRSGGQATLKYYSLPFVVRDKVGSSKPHLNYTKYQNADNRSPRH